MPTEKPAVFKRLHDLGPEIVAEVDKRLLAGDTAINVANYLQIELKVLTDLQPGSVRKNLERYRSTALKAKIVDELVDVAFGKSASTIKKQLLAHEELQALAVIQKTRFEKVFMNEASVPKMTLPMVDNQARLLKEVLVELGKLQLETGIVRRAPKTVTGATFDPATGTVTEFSWTEEQERMMRQIETLELDAVDMTPQKAPEGV